MHPNSSNQVRFADRQCKLVVVQDQLQPCPYLDGVTARMPLQLPVGSVTPAITDRLLENGYRRSGDFVYRTQCPSCTECLPTRIETSTFQFTKSMKRVLQRGDRELVALWDQPEVDSRRVELFNLHREQRSLGRGDEVDAESYRSFLVESCCDSLELKICLDDKLIAIAIVDIGQSSVSAVYTFFDPAMSRYSLGTYALLKTIQWARQSERPFVYLGMYVAANRHLNYKARFSPQQRLIRGEWVDVDDRKINDPKSGSRSGNVVSGSRANHE
tara:strand:- start:193063 stop:193878 length:816 start_codon:yes stop_codon:yes gene_type:complete